ncbi:MAG: transposase, partial [Clostridia bacterium]|nr:transposase [Clostridia bacterium]
MLFEILVCAYILGVYTSRKIEQLCRNHIQFILILDGHEAPDHTTIARFRSGKATSAAIEDLFQQYIEILIQEGWIDKDELYVDGTKIESKANRYTFVWRKTVERELGKIREKARELLKPENGYATRGKLSEKVEALEKEIREEGLSEQKGRGHHKPEKIRLRDQHKELLERWNSYEEKKRILGEKRNSYSKT